MALKGLALEAEDLVLVNDIIEMLADQSHLRNFLDFKKREEFNESHRLAPLEHGRQNIELLDCLSYMRFGSLLL